MPPSQLKRLKSSLRDQGITGPQKSQRQKKAAAKDTNSRINRNAALQQIRDSFNPFELKPAKPAKFESVSHKSANAAGKKYKEVLHRPGVSKSAGEEMRKAQLLPEMRGRNKIGGLIDRRIGEGDASMTAEARAAERFAREKKNGASMFDLEGSDGESGGIRLTHLGQSLDEFDGDDFPDEMSEGSDEGSDDGFLQRKRRRSDDFDEEETVQENGEAEPERKKTKKEVMQEVIAKSKLHKYERQKTKEDDEDIRDELDKGMSDMLALLNGHPAPPKPVVSAEPAINDDGPMINPDRQRLLDGMDRKKADKEYEVRLRQLAMDTRAKPSDRSKTEEEKAAAQSEKLKKQEEKRMKRMRGEAVSDDEDERTGKGNAAKVEDSADMDALDDTEYGEDQAEEFGLTSSMPQSKEKEGNVVLEDEDEFAVDADLVASDSDPDLSEDSENSDADSDAGADVDQEEEDEFVKGILGNAQSATGANSQTAASSTGLTHAYPCPRNHEELLDIVKDKPAEQLPTIIQRIRALRHASLSATNKEAQADFSCALIDHISYMGQHNQPLAVIEQVIRHLHSLSRSYPERIGEAFREHLQAFQERGSPTAGDLVILTAIGSIYPTSDHFHQVVTPAITLIAKWLGLTAGASISAKELVQGAFLVSLSVNYQKISKRYVPEAVRFTLKVLTVKPALDAELAAAHIENVTAMADLWKDKTAFIDIFTPFLPALKALNAKKPHQHLKILLQQSILSRRPLELHHHKQQPIRMSVPKFEEGFNPDKHYDPDKERSEAKKLQKEYKREKKGAVRELRKDANFIAREQLREKRIRDEEHEKKQRRLIAEIQGEEGHEAKEYEREKRRRKSGR